METNTPKFELFQAVRIAGDHNRAVVHERFYNVDTQEYHYGLIISNGIVTPLIKEGALQADKEKA